MVKYNSISKVVKYSIAAAVFAISIGSSACHKDDSEFLEAVKNINPKIKSEQLLESRSSTRESDANESQVINVINNIYCGTNGRCNNGSQSNGLYGSGNVGGCGHPAINCELPEKYKNHTILCEDPASHCRNQSDSWHELLIKYVNGTLFNDTANPSYLPQNKVKVNYKDGSNPKQGLELEKIIFLVQNANTCEYTEVVNGGSVPNGWKNIMITEFGYDSNGNLFQIASTPYGEWVNNVGGAPRVPSGTVPGIAPIPTSSQPSQSGQPAQPTQTPQSGQPTLGLESILNLPVLDDNQWNYPTIDWSPALGNEIPDEFYIGVCQDGTDGTGKIITPCTEDRIIGNDFKIKFIYKNKDKLSKGIIYEGFIPDISGNQKATYTIIGYKLNGQIYGTKVTSQTVSNHNADVKEKKKCFLKKLINKKS